MYTTKELNHIAFNEPSIFDQVGKPAYVAPGPWGRGLGVRLLWGFPGGFGLFFPPEARLFKKNSRQKWGKKGDPPPTKITGARAGRNEKTPFIPIRPRGVLGIGGVWGPRFSPSPKTNKIASKFGKI